MGLRGDVRGGQTETLTSERVSWASLATLLELVGTEPGALRPRSALRPDGTLRLIKASTEQQRRFGVNSYVLNVKLMKNQILFQETLFSASPAHAWFTK